MICPVGRSRMSSNDKAIPDLTALPAGTINAKKGIDRIAITEWSRDTWVTLVCRLVSQGLADPVLDNDKTENDSSTSDSSNLVETMRSNIREKLFAYVMANFRERLDIIIAVRSSAHPENRRYAVEGFAG